VRLLDEQRYAEAKLIVEAALADAGDCGSIPASNSCSDDLKR